MKRLALVLCAIALTLLLLCPLAWAGSCSYRGYGYSSPSYGYGYSSGYGSSYYQPGYYYWSGGYWPGGGGYGSGYYYPGYYQDKSYNSCSYHAYTPVVPYFPKYEAAVLVAKFPSYGVYAREDLPAAAPAAGGYSAAPAAGYTAPAAIDGKLDKILVAVTTVSQDVAELKAWRAGVDQKLGNPPAPARNTAPAAAPEKPDGPSILHTRCAACHDFKNVERERSKITLFVTGNDGPEMASLNAKGEIEPLPVATLRKIEKVLTDGTMPPPRDAAGKAVAAMTQAERAASLEFIRKVLAGGK